MAKVSITSLGCPRNRIDSEVMAGFLKEAGFSIVPDDGDSDIRIVNTCAFIGPAREESIDKILEAGYLKKKGGIKRLVIAGCLPQLYKGKLSSALREADLVLGTGDFPKIAELLKMPGRRLKRTAVSDDPDFLYDERSPRISSAPRHYRYIKISEGCSNHCSYCIISRLRGSFRSRSIESVINEARNASSDGMVKELILVGQDTTLFGRDLYARIMFPELLRRLSEAARGVKWIRILYTHPAHYSDELISVIRGEDKICKYLDLPIQHISDNILTKMNRNVSARDIRLLIEKLRKRIPGLALRTSIITGFPGETPRDFKILKDFLTETEFERLGAFAYSREDGTRAARFTPQVPEKVKLERLDEIMKLQQKISLKINRSRAGRIADVLIDAPVEWQKGVYAGRTYADSPDIDGSVRVTGSGIKAGRFYKVRITDASEYDLAGEKV